MTDLLDRMGRKGGDSGARLPGDFRTWATGNNELPVREVAKWRSGIRLGNEVERAYFTRRRACETPSDHARVGRVSRQAARAGQSDPVASGRVMSPDGAAADWTTEQALRGLPPAADADKHKQRFEKSRPAGRIILHGAVVRVDDGRCIWKKPGGKKRWRAYEALLDKLIKVHKITERARLENVIDVAASIYRYGRSALDEPGNANGANHLESHTGDPVLL